MNEEKFDRLEKIMEQLIKMVGSNNAVTEELRQRMDNLETKMDSGFEELTAMVNMLGEKTEAIDNKIATILATQTTQGESINILAMRQLQIEAEVAALKKAK